MPRKFKDVDGKEYDLDYLLNNFRVTLDPNTDIVTEDKNGGVVCLDNEPHAEVNDSYYEAINKIING